MEKNNDPFPEVVMIAVIALFIIMVPLLIAFAPESSDSSQPKQPAAVAQPLAPTPAVTVPQAAPPASAPPSTTSNRELAIKEASALGQLRQLNPSVDGEPRPTATWRSGTEYTHLFVQPKAQGADQLTTELVDDLVKVAGLAHTLGQDNERFVRQITSGSKLPAITPKASPRRVHNLVLTSRGTVTAQAVKRQPSSAIPIQLMGYTQALGPKRTLSLVAADPPGVPQHTVLRLAAEQLCLANLSRGLQMCRDWSDAVHFKYLEYDYATYRRYVLSGPPQLPVTLLDQRQYAALQLP